MKHEWVLLVYKIPPHPTRLRAQVWRQLQRCGAIYLQNSVSIVPATSELAENMRWIADEIREMGGEAFVLRATAGSPAEERQIEGLFGETVRRQARRLSDSLSRVEKRVRHLAKPEDVDAAEDEVRRIRQAALKLRLRSHFPVREEEDLQRRLGSLRERLDRQALRRPGRR
jgi:hypothetical protein